MPPKKIKVLNSIIAAWPSSDPLDSANADNLHPKNLKDNGFNALNLRIPAARAIDPAPPSTPPIFATPASEERYLLVLRDKLWWAQSFIVTEGEHKLSLTRRMDKDATATTLAQGPIPFSLYMQEVIRDSVNVREQILEWAKHKSVDDDEMQPLARTFFWTWEELKTMLGRMVPGESEESRQRKAEDIMEDVMGANLVEGVERVEGIDGEVQEGATE
jgi:hypothetical protein